MALRFHSSADGLPFPFPLNFRIFLKSEKLQTGRAQLLRMWEKALGGGGGCDQDSQHPRGLGDPLGGC